MYAYFVALENKVLPFEHNDKRGNKRMVRVLLNPFRNEACFLHNTMQDTKFAIPH